MSAPRRSVLTPAEVLALSMPQKRSKYNARKTGYSGQIYDSAAEARRAAELDVLVKCGEIFGWERQKPYVIAVNDVYICTYIADFWVCDGKGGIWLEDVKGMATPVYKLKKKLFAACYPTLELREIAA